MLRGGVWRFAYTPYEAYREMVRADGGWYKMRVVMRDVAALGEMPQATCDDGAG